MPKWHVRLPVSQLAEMSGVLRCKYRSLGSELQLHRATRAVCAEGQRWLTVSKTHSQNSSEKAPQKNKALQEYEKMLSQRTTRAVKHAIQDVDYKRKLFIFCFGKVPPNYQDSIDSEKGKYACTVRLRGEDFRGLGDTRVEAQQRAAQKAYEAIPKEDLVKKKLEPEASRPEVPKGVQPPTDPARWHSLGKLKRKKLTAVEIVPHPWDAPVPTLQHGLEQVLKNNNSVATPLFDRRAKGIFDFEYLRKIEQPHRINWAALTTFVPPSNDPTLHRLTLEQNKKYKASTSSITGLLGSVFQVLSNDRPVDLSSLSEQYQDMSRKYTVTLR
mmetsp:Transcript_7465/g.11760  ORF Transcript_7465/g.11760 Transcript_7465/m.11760 type:complete len:328 (+) Transcript_7465:107-1090(+)